MRKQEKVIIWPSYFDSGRTRKDGRRVPKNLAVVSPRINEIKEAADKLRLGCELVPDVGYPKAPMAKSGMLLVDRKGSKSKTVVMIARQLLKNRSAVAVQ